MYICVGILYSRLREHTLYQKTRNLRNPSFKPQADRLLLMARAAVYSSSSSNITTNIYYFVRTVNKCTYCIIR